jgi:hypothetical protein
MGQVGYWRNLRQNNNQMMLGGAADINNVWYLTPQGGVNLPGATKRNSFSTFAELSPNLRNRDIVYLLGVLKEQALAPLGVFDVTIVGAANTPRQATSSGVPTGGGAYWTYPTATTPTAATALITLREQGWSFQNICFNPYTSSPAIEGIRAESATYPDPSHLSIDGCYFIGGGSGQIGFQDSGGLFNVSITNSYFQSLATAIKGVAGAGIATPLRHLYADNYFLQNTNDIVIGCSYGRIMRNSFKNTTTQKVDLTAGGHEIVTLNFFDDNAADIDPAHGYTGSATGTWLNYVLDQAALQVGQPA